MDLRLTALALVALVALAPGCSYRAHVGAHDGGSTDPSCDTAVQGDSCATEGRLCGTGACGVLICRMGVMQLDLSGCSDGGPWCECPAPPPGCYYDGAGCPCSHLTCPGETCGRTTCGEGTVCCNASCGVCVPPGLACSAEICAPDCTPQDAQGDGLCARSLGIWAWDGTACRELSGCMTCQGADCASTFATQAACEATFSECGRACGGFIGAVCGAGEYCDFPEPHFCGGADEQGVCRPTPTDCPPEIRTVCGCDGNTYAAPCSAHQGGTDVQREGACDASCEADDARGVGGCDAVIGVVWTGTRCTYLSGCSCEGTDCETVRRNETACNDAHAHCIVPHG